MHGGPAKPFINNKAAKKIFSNKKKEGVNLSEDGKCRGVTSAEKEKKGTLKKKNDWHFKKKGTGGIQ